MTTMGWPTKRLSVASLLLDERNPRLGEETNGLAPREIIQYLFDHDKTMEIARSIATRGYFENEPLLAISNGRHYVVVEGNRRLAALKALKEPRLLSDRMATQVEQLARQADLDAISRIPVTIAPDRRSTDRLIAGRHVGTPVLAWRAENRANFILSKLDEGYSNDEVRHELGFSDQDTQKARQTRAIAQMARSVDVPDEVKAKVDNPRVKLFSTLERVLDSSVGRQFLQIKPDADHGFVGTTTKAEFLRGFANLVTDIVLQRETSRSLNTNQNITDYFEQRNPAAAVAKKKGRFVPTDVISTTSANKSADTMVVKKTKRTSQTVLPSNFKVRVGNERLVEIRGELIRLKRDRFPNAGAVLLRVFLELAIKDYLERTGRLQELKGELRAKGKLAANQPLTMRQLSAEITAVAKSCLSGEDATMVEKALRHDRAAPFSISDLHAFVHHPDFPGERDILQFWTRTEPLFRLMLEEETEDSSR